MKTYPTPTEIVTMRNNLRLTQTQAANVIGVGLRTWQKWEAGDARMDPIKLEMFKLKVKQ